MFNHRSARGIANFINPHWGWFMGLGLPHEPRILGYTLTKGEICGDVINGICHELWELSIKWQLLDGIIMIDKW